MAQADSRRPLTMENRVLSQVRLVVDKVALGQVFFRVLRVSPGNIIAPYLRLHVALTGGTNERSLGTCRHYNRDGWEEPVQIAGARSLILLHMFLCFSNRLRLSPSHPAAESFRLSVKI